MSLTFYTSNDGSEALLRRKNYSDVIKVGPVIQTYNTFVLNFHDETEKN